MIVAGQNVSNRLREMECSFKPQATSCKLQAEYSLKLKAKSRKQNAAASFKPQAASEYSYNQEW
jgi:hypothetical protein